MSNEALNYQKFIVNNVFYSGSSLDWTDVNKLLQVRKAYLAQESGLIEMFERALILCVAGTTASSRAEFAKRLNRELNRLCNDMEASWEVQEQIDSFIASLGLDPDKVADGEEVL